MKKMFHSFLFSFLFYCSLTAFADTDDVKSVSVTEGDSVTLNHSVTEIKTNDVIDWTFAPETLIARIRGPKSFKTDDDVLNGRFRDRLKLDHQTGSLTITNTRTTDTGLYQVTVRGDKPITNRFSVTVYARLPVPVITRNCTSSSSSSSPQHCTVVCSVVNVSHVTLSWIKGNSLLSSISVSDLSISLSLPLEVEDQEKNTYSCEINNTITHQTTHLDISVTCRPCKTFTSTVPQSPSTSTPSHPSPSHSTSGPDLQSSRQTLMFSAAAAVAGALLTVVLVLICYICRKHRKTAQENDTKGGRKSAEKAKTDEDITYADPVFYKRKPEKSDDEVVYAGIVTRR